MVEITATEQNKEKIIGKNEDSLRDLWDNINCTNIYIIGIPEREKREKGPEKIFKEIIAKNEKEHEKGNTHSSLGSTENPIQDKLKEEHTETHISQTDKN